METNELASKFKTNIVKQDNRKKSNIVNGIVTSNCIVCDKTNYNYIPNIGTRFCSWKCYDTNKQQSTKPNVKCEVCGKEFYLKPSRLTRVIHGITCSDKCKYLQKAKYMSGEGNHQYGLKGENNSSFKGEEILNEFGYKMMYLPNHPKADKNGRYRTHRYVVEQNLKLDDSFFTIINNQRVLKDEYVVHHIDENKTNNDSTNLVIYTRGEHTTHHNNEKEIIRDAKGRIIGVLKSCELLENLEEDNQQPNITEM